MPRQNNIKQFLSFNRGERFGLILFFLIMLIIILANILLPGFFMEQSNQNLRSFKSDIDNFENTQQSKKGSIEQSSHAYDSEREFVSHLTPFPFDPNNLPDNQWQSLGLSDKQIQIIKNYEARGGHFYKASDLAKIYGISQAEFEVLQPFISINKTLASNTKTDNKERRLHPFEFNPNTIDEEGLIKLGLSEKLISTLIHYRNKGGHFYHPDDLGKIYGMDTTIFQQLIPYIIIKPDTISVAYQSKATNLLIDLNHADTLDLQQLQGIGSGFARRIAKYGQLLGGYHHNEQLLEVYGMDSLRYAQITNHVVESTDSLKKININTASIKELMKHPYIEFYLAKSIISQRDKVGQFQSLDELLDARLVYDDLFNKLKPYLTL